jgi:hypothetical protein
MEAYPTFSNRVEHRDIEIRGARVAACDEAHAELDGHQRPLDPCRQADTHTDRQSDTQTDRQAGSQTERQTDSQAYRQTDG